MSASSSTTDGIAQLLATLATRLPAPPTYTAKMVLAVVQRCGLQGEAMHAHCMIAKDAVYVDVGHLLAKPEVPKTLCLSIQTSAGVCADALCEMALQDKEGMVYPEFEPLCGDVFRCADEKELEDALRTLMENLGRATYPLDA